VVPSCIAALVSVMAASPPPEPAGGWRSPAARCEAMAASLDIAPALRPVVADLCHRAPTFRRQIARLAAQPDLTLTVRPVAFASTVRWRAQTTIERVEGRVRLADVRVQPGDARLLAELIAHEFEHVLEQLDGVDLGRWIGRAGVRRVGADERGSPIETERAQQVGRLVAGEYRSAPAELTAARRR
jgi:hypothetical protein